MPRLDRSGFEPKRQSDSETEHDFEPKHHCGFQNECEVQPKREHKNDHESRFFLKKYFG